MYKNINVKNKKNFDTIYREYVLNKYKEKVYLHVLTNTEESYFDIDKINNKYLQNMKVTKELTEIVRECLKKEGWKTTLSYGGTGLFIYADKKPVNCYPDNL